MTGSDTLIYRLLFNLTENAIKYNRPRRRRALSVTPEPEKLLIRVADTGRGILNTFSGAFSSPFSGWISPMTPGIRRRGLGAFAGVEIVKLHGGTVCVENSSEAGTTVAVSFPLR